MSENFERTVAGRQANRARAIGWAAFVGIAVACPGLLVAWQAAPRDHVWPQIAAWSLCSVLVLLLVNRRVWIGLALLAPLAVLAPVEFWYTASYGVPSDAHALGLLVETNPSEASSFVAGRVFVWLGLTLLAAALVAVLAVLRAREAALVWPHRLRAWLFVASVAAMSLPALVSLATAGPETDPTAAPTADPGMAIADLGLDPMWRDLSRAYPAGLPLRTSEFLRFRATLRQLGETLADFRFGAHLRASDAPARQGRRVHVLVIGETSRPDRWQLNGYARPTSPRLAQEPNLVSFTDMVSPWAWTRMAVPVIVTRKPGAEARPFFPERSLVAAYREAGFRTYWFSAHSPLGTHDSSTALHAQESHDLRFVNPGSYERRAAVDGELLPMLREALARDEPRQLIVLHTLGSHYDYSHRYPPAFDRFRPSLLGHPSPSLHDRGQRDAMSNAYDNSILYTDHVLAEVVAALRATGAAATMLYVADHGENLFDGECGLSGHGRHTERDHRVAAMFWHSDAYARERPDSVQQARQRRDERLSTENVFHSMLDLAGITYPGETLSASLFDASWRPRPRIVQSGLDFDQAARDPVCLELLPGQQAGH